jgi:putative addiction module component (TIGR02574 family)
MPIIKSFNQCKKKLDRLTEVYYIIEFFCLKENGDSIIMTSESILNEIGKLDIAERILLIEAAWDNICLSDDKVPVPKWQKNELDRRLSGHESDRETSVQVLLDLFGSWEDSREAEEIVSEIKQGRKNSARLKNGF